MESPILLLQSNNNEITNSQLWQAAQLYLQLGKTNQSLRLAYEAFQKDSSYQDTYQKHYLKTIRLGAEFAEEIEDYARAAYYWQQLTQQQSNNAEAWYGLGIAKANLKDYSGAIAALKKCLQIKPEHANAGLRLSQIQQLL